MNATVQGDPRPNTIPQNLFDHPTNLLVIHQSDSDRLYHARMSIECLAHLVLGDGKIDQEPVQFIPEQLACMLTIIAEKLDIPETSYVNVFNARAISQTQGEQL